MTRRASCDQNIQQETRKTCAGKENQMLRSLVLFPREPLMLQSKPVPHEEGPIKILSMLVTKQITTSQI